MNICYLDFWPGFDINCNFFNLVFREVLNDKEINFNASPEESDVIMASSFGVSRYNYLNTKGIKIFYTGENEPPDFKFGDYALSFDFESYGGKNFRFPHWFLYVNWWGEPDFPHARISLKQLFHQHDPDEVLNRPEFCSIIIGNPVQNRYDVAVKLNTYKPVHGYGKAFGNHYEGCKIKLMENYRYNICFENSIREGYITEKLLEAKVAGCIPIYYGHPSVKFDFNEKCFLNYYEYESDQDLYKNVCRLENNPRLFKSFVKEPLFNKNPDLSELYRFIKHLLNSK